MTSRTGASRDPEVAAAEEGVRSGVAAVDGRSRADELATWLGARVTSSGETLAGEHRGTGALNEGPSHTCSTRTRPCVSTATSQLVPGHPANTLPVALFCRHVDGLLPVYALRLSLLARLCRGAEVSLWRHWLEVDAWRHPHQWRHQWQLRHLFRDQTQCRAKNCNNDVTVCTKFLRDYL